MKIKLFGVRTPLVVDYEETCKRLDLQIAAGLNADPLLQLSRVGTASISLA